MYRYIESDIYSYDLKTARIVYEILWSEIQSSIKILFSSAFFFIDLLKRYLTYKEYKQSEGEKANKARRQSRVYTETEKKNRSHLLDFYQLCIAQTEKPKNHFDLCIKFVLFSSAAFLVDVSKEHAYIPS